METTSEERQRHLQYMSNVLHRYLTEGDGPSVDAIKASIGSLERKGKMESQHSPDLEAVRRLVTMLSRHAEIGLPAHVVTEAEKALPALLSLLAKTGLQEDALNKINKIRNSIIGFQTVNWSEHIYPLVEALNAAGFQGMEYPEAREKFQPLLVRIIALEAENERLREENAQMKAAITKAAEEGLSQ